MLPPTYEFIGLKISSLFLGNFSFETVSTSKHKFKEEPSMKTLLFMLTELTLAGSPAFLEFSAED
jgi:hypothetical protein